MDKHLPIGLEKLLSWILDNNTVQSWRYSGEHNLILSIRFTPMADTDIVASQSNLSSVDIYSGQAKSYRSKPPSSVNRDNMHQQAWLGNTQGDHSIEGTFSKHDMFVNMTDFTYFSTYN